MNLKILCASKMKNTLEKHLLKSSFFFKRKENKRFSDLKD